jgi:flagellar export protein FliJ
MKEYRFTLQALLTLRIRQEQAAQEVYAQALAVRHQALLRLQEAQHECQGAQSLSRERTAAGAPAAQLAQIGEYCRAMNERRERCAETLDQAQRVAAQRLEKLIAVRRAREVVDKFQKRQREKYDRELTREEQKLLDELATQRVPSIAVSTFSPQGDQRERI